MSIRPWVWLAIAFQLGLLVWMAGQREWVLANGEVIHLRTAPVDPRDLFRGDYVQLDYEISVFSLDQFGGAIAEGERLPPGERVYVGLERGPEGVARATGVDLEPPSTGLFLRGRVLRDWRLAGGDALRVGFGIEKYFVEQGAGRVMEQQRGRRGGLQQPMEVAVAVADNGLGVLKGHRWSRIRIGLTQVNVPPPAAQSPVDPLPDSPQQPPAAILDLTLGNPSSEPLDLVMLPDYCAFSVHTVKGFSQPIHLNQEACRKPDLEQARIVTLAPGEVHVTRFDFNEKRWHFPLGGELRTIDTLPRGGRFRIHYQPPELGARGTPAQWRGTLPSPAFHGAGRID